MARLIKLVFDCYLSASIHVAFSVLALTQTTVLILKIPKIEDAILGFIFFGTVVFYNIMKYYHLKDIFFQMRFWKPILFITLISLVLQFFFFLQMSFFSKSHFFVVGIIVATYPFFRKIIFLKMFFVAFSITVVTAFIPIYYDKFLINDCLIFLLSRFLFLFCLLIPFEIKDFKIDSKTITTIPHQLGIQKTKLLGYLVISILFVLNSEFRMIVVLLLTTIAIYKSKQNSSKYFVTFWVESIPIIAYFLFLI